MNVSFFDLNPLAKDILSAHTRMGLTKCGWTSTYRANPEQWISFLTLLDYPSFDAWYECMHLFGGVNINPRISFSADHPYQVTSELTVVPNSVTPYSNRIKLHLDDPIIQQEAKNWKIVLEQYASAYQYAPIGVIGNVPLFIFSNGWIVSGGLYRPDSTVQKQYFFRVQGETIFHSLNRHFHVCYVGSDPDD